MRTLFLLIFLLSCRSGFSTNQYYVDSESGNDSNNGQSPSKAWASLEKINSTLFKPGDVILFKSGSVWNGQLELKGSGKKVHPS